MTECDTQFNVYHESKIESEVGNGIDSNGVSFSFFDINGNSTYEEGID
jgi:hypothetical protein